MNVVPVKHAIVLGLALALGWTLAFPSVPVGGVADGFGIPMREAMRAAPGRARRMKRAPAVPARTTAVLLTGCAFPFIPTASCCPA